MMFTNEDNIARLPKERLLNPLNFILTESEHSNIVDKSDHTKIKEINKAMSDLPGNETGYSVTSKMLSENELLITLPYDDNITNEEKQKMSFIEDTDYQINIVDDTNNLELEKQSENTKMLNTNSSDTAPKILSVLYLNANLKETLTTDHTSQNSLITEEIHFSDTENEPNVKTLTVLNNVEINAKYDAISDLTNDINESQSNSDSFVFEKECQEESKTMDLDKQPEEIITPKKFSHPLKRTVPFTNKKITKPRRTQRGQKSKTATRKKQTRKTITHSKASRSVLLDLLVDPPTEYVKQNSVVRTYSHKKKTNLNNINEKSTLYQKIQPPPEQEVEKEPDKFAVFDFYDEEEDLVKKEEKLTMLLLRERTCMYCNELFKDPMDVLRHKREAHKHRKIELTREEIEPYLHLESRVHCPLCFKLIHPCGYKSFYVKHLMIHCKSSDFSCKVCGIKFKRKDHMLMHEKRHVVLTEATK